MNQPPPSPPPHPRQQPPPPFPSLPLPSPSHPYTPNSNFQLHHPYPPPSCTTTTTTASSSAPDLPTALSTLTSLLHLTQTTLNSVSSLLPAPTTHHLIPCPFNPNHLLPPPYLFSHYLSCPSSPTPLSPSLLHSLYYPHTLRSTPFTQSLQNSNSSELCFSLESFLSFSQNFFYLDCPAPVTIDQSNNEHLSSPPMLTLPGILSGECGNFTRTNGCIDGKCFDLDSIKLLPSEIWAIRNETTGWDDYPVSYSFRVLRAILKLGMSDLLCLPTWIITNSPKYGIVIDVSMTDHIVLLYKLCLKAVIREAINFSNLLFGREGEEELGRDKRKFGCPILAEAMRWLGSQLSLLYGEVNGKFFAINMLKQCIVESALNSPIFPLVEKSLESPELKEMESEVEVPVEESGEEDRKMIQNGSVKDNVIFVSQVAAAVAALYERSWLELKIKALRDPRPLNAYHRMVEHEYISKRAEVERQQRSNYRPVIEHDGLIWPRTHNQDGNRIKTREELLAEERDYKRRRMSYRGKKMKRSTTQVMRDIIEEFMEEIKQAGSLAKRAEQVEPRACESPSARDGYLGTLKPEKYQTAIGTSRGQPHDYGENLPSHSHRSVHLEEKYLEDYKQHRYDSRRHQVHLEKDRSIKRARDDTKDYSRSPDRRRSRSYLSGHTSNRGKRDDPEISRETLSRSSDRSHSKSQAQKHHQTEEIEYYPEIRNRHSRERHRDPRSDILHTEFEDRYNPSEQHDVYEDGG